MSESIYMRRVMLQLARVATVFRHNVGEAWAGRTGASGPGWVRLLDPRRIRFGLTPGGADIIGWVPVIITEEHVGQRLAVFLAAETKGAQTNITKEQLNFLERLADDGGIAILTREGAGDDIAGIIAEARKGQAPGRRVYGALPRPRGPRKQPQT